MIACSRSSALGYFAAAARAISLSRRWVPLPPSGAGKLRRAPGISKPLTTPDAILRIDHALGNHGHMVMRALLR